MTGAATGCAGCSGCKASGGRAIPTCQTQQRRSSEQQQWLSVAEGDLRKSGDAGTDQRRLFLQESELPAIRGRRRPEQHDVPPRKRASRGGRCSLAAPAAARSPAKERRERRRLGAAANHRAPRRAANRRRGGGGSRRMGGAATSSLDLGISVNVLGNR